MCHASKIVTKRRTVAPRRKSLGIFGCPILAPAPGARVGSLFSVQRNCAPVLVSLLPIVVSLGAPSSPPLLGRGWASGFYESS